MFGGSSISGFRSQSGTRPRTSGAAEVVVISSAVKPDNPEVIAARVRRLPVVRRAEMLGELMRLKWSLAIAGTHGKTTTTSMIGALLETAQLDPTVINGGIINAYGTNTRLGSRRLDGGRGRRERRHLHPAAGDDRDRHQYRSGASRFLRQTSTRCAKPSRTFVGNIPFYGFAALCIDHPVVQGMIPKLSDRRVLTYGFSPQADIRAVDVRLGRDGARYDIVVSDALVGSRAHDRRACFCRCSAGTTCRIRSLPRRSPRRWRSATTRCGPRLRNFKGVKRRFTKTGEWNGVTVIDDYGHHPVEIAAVLKAARAIVEGKVIAVVQPHRYTRVSHLFDGFCTCFNDADIVLVADVYAAGEAPIEGVSRDALVAGLIEHGHRNVRPLGGPAAISRRSSGNWRAPATWSCAWARARSPAGRTACRPISLRCNRRARVA